MSEYGEAMTWQGRALQNLHRLDELVAALRNVCNVFVESRIHDNNLQKMDDSLSETYDWMHRTHMSLRRYEREMADTTQALPAGFADQPPFDKAFHIPFILPRRLETIADWHHFVRQRLLELVAQQRPLQDEAAVLETRRQQLHAERTVLLNLMWREENFAD